MGIFTLSNLLSALSGRYSMLVASRIITSISQGAFLGVGSVVAAGLVPENRRASAVASMFMGLTIANFGGVPFTSWVGGAIGWRSAFWIIAGFEGD
jgi:MFS transporter, DHA1 family, inner membrane transport protein